MKMTALWRSALAGMGLVLAIANPSIAQQQGPEILPHQFRLTATAGAIEAEVSYQRSGSNLSAIDRYQVTNQRIKITRSGQVLIDEPLPPSPTGDMQQPLLSSLQIRDLDRDSQAEVILDLGNAMTPQICCTYSLIYRYEPDRQTYSYLTQGWGYAGYTLRDFDQDGTPEFFSGDNRFSNQVGLAAPPRSLGLTSSGFVEAVLPLQIWRYRAGRMEDVTRNYPTALNSHAFVLWLDYRARVNAGDAFVRTDPVMRAYWAAYLADKTLMGQQPNGWQVVQQAYQGADRQSFFARLRQLLNESGYR
jgi:hypothetical protein